MKRRLSLLLFFIGVLLSVNLSAQTNISCTISVKDDSGQPLQGAAVLVKGTNTGEVTGSDGVCHFTSIASNAVFTVTSLGFEDKDINVNGRTQIAVTLKLSAEMMEEVVVVGYGVQRRKDLSGAVAQVKGEVINEFASYSVAGALQGRVSGVQVSTLNGQPGAGMQVRIRGANSIKGNNEPLWIINGFPGDVNMINTSDIESVEILKDASATAIYGSRGANGVVIISTKSAKEGKIRVTYDGSVGVQNLTKQIEMLSGDEYMNYLNDKAAIQGNPAIFTEQQIAENLYNTNWQDELFRPAVITNHSVDVSGGTQKMKSSFGVSYFNQDGIVKESGYQRLSIRTDLKYDISKFFSLNGNIIFSRSDHDQMNSQGGGAGGTSVIGASLAASPLATPHYDDGTWNDFQTQPIAGMNPLAYQYEVKSKWYANRLNATLGLTLRPLKGLSVNVSANVNNNNSRRDNFKSKKYPESKGSAGITFGETLHFTSNNIITYDSNFGKHHLNVMGGVTYEESTSKNASTGTAEEFLSDVVETYDLDAATIKGLPTSSYSNWKLLSFLGRVNYNYDNRYLLTVNFRADGSSRYSHGDKWGYFPSAAFAWRLSQENFMRNLSWLDELKIRVGYGKTGSTAISPYSTQNTLSSVNVVLDKELVVGYAPLDRYLGGLRWETTSQFNAGIDFALFGNRLKLTADAYYKRTTDLLNDVEMPRSSGYTTALRNIGEISNKGVEIQLDGRPIDKQVKWDLGINFSLNRSRIEKLAAGNDIFGPTVSNTIIRDNLNIMREGEPMYMFYGYVEKGYDDNGQIIYEDLDEDGEITTADKGIIGNPNPDFLLNFNTSISYYGFTLSAFFQGSFGNDIYSLTNCSLGYHYNYNANALREVYYNHWTPERPDAKYPNLLSNLDLKMSDRFVFDGTYLRLKNLEFSYSIPVKKKVLSAARVYLSAQNLFTITSYPMWDPDVNASGGGNSLAQGIDSFTYPTARTFTLGCRLSF